MATKIHGGSIQPSEAPRISAWIKVQEHSSFLHMIVAKA